MSLVEKFKFYHVDANIIIAPTTSNCSSLSHRCRRRGQFPSGQQCPGQFWSLRGIGQDSWRNRRTRCRCKHIVKHYTPFTRSSNHQANIEQASSKRQASMKHAW